MTAVDTNILVRLLVEDDAKQAAEARAILAAGPVWIAKTVFLETAWVLGRLYGLDRGAVRDAFDTLLGLENVQVEDEPAVAEALALMAHGIDFADAFHLSSRPPGVLFVSFDRSLVRRAQKAGVQRVAEVADR
ncbi:Twitching motility protein PilT [Candidatus Sulfopaludibacter sp. SbA3]|nr:Twitching motility protein PilT [Candidatus Sulfopaludibacter sp. SbA3]